MSWVAFVAWVDSVPAVIWSGAIGAVIALLGAVFVNWSNTTRLRMQLAHDGEQKERDRLAALRKDVYLEAPKEAVKALSYLAKLSSRDLATIGDDEGIAGFAAVAAQISVLSDLETATDVNRLGNAMAMELVRAMRDLEEVQDTRVDIGLREDRLRIVTAEIQRIQAEQQNMSEVGDRDPERRSALAFWLEARMEEAEKLRNLLDELRPKHQRLLSEYNKGFFGRMSQIAAQNVRVMRAIRKEIGLAHDLERYEAEMNELAAKLRSESLAMMDGWANSMEASAPTPRPLPAPPPGD